MTILSLKDLIFLGYYISSIHNSDTERQIFFYFFYFYGHLYFYGSLRIFKKYNYNKLYDTNF